MSKFDDFNNEFNDYDIENSIKKAKKISFIRNTIIALVVSIITIGLVVIINNMVYIKSSNDIISKLESDIEATIPTGYISDFNLTQGFLGGRIDYNISKVVGNRSILLERKSESYGLNQTLTGMGRTYKGNLASDWNKIDTWESGYRKMLFFHPSIKYKEYPNDLNNLDNMSDDKVVEMAISLDKAYSKSEIFNLAYDMRNIKIKWIWLDTFTLDEMNTFENEVKELEPKSCGISESNVRGMEYTQNNMNIYSGMSEFNSMYNSWIEYLRNGDESDTKSNENNKKLYEQLVKDGKENSSNIKILGFIVEGTKKELSELIDKPYIKASTFGVAIEPLY